MIVTGSYHSVTEVVSLPLSPHYFRSHRVPPSSFLTTCRGPSATLRSRLLPPLGRVLTTPYGRVRFPPGGDETRGDTSGSLTLLLSSTFTALGSDESRLFCCHPLHYPSVTLTLHFGLVNE